MKYCISLKLNRDFRRAYAKGKTVVTPSIAVYARQTKYNNNRLGVTVSTKIGKAVVRNKLRRRLKEIYRTNEEKIAIGYDIVIVARHKCRTTGYWALEAEFLRAAKKLGILKGE